MRITFVLGKLDFSGGVISTIELANRLFQKGHEVTIVHPSIIIGPRFKWYNFRSVFSNLSKIKKTEQILSKRISIESKMLNVPTLNEKNIPDADAIIATWWETAYYVSNYPISKGIKFYFVRAYEVWYGSKTLVDKTYSLPLHIITTSNYLKTHLKRGFEVDALELVPNGVDFDLFYRTHPPSYCGKPKRVGMVYRQPKWKGMQDGFQAFQIAKNHYPDLQLVLFGSPLGNDVPRDVEFHEYPPIAELRDLYNSLDVFMLPSHSGEGFAKPPMEAMACGVPCVLTNVGAVPDYTVAGKTALVSPPNDPEALAKNLLTLVTDDLKRKDIAEAGHNHIKGYSWDKSASKLEALLKQWVHNSD